MFNDIMDNISLFIFIGIYGLYKGQSHWSVMLHTIARVAWVLVVQFTYYGSCSGFWHYVWHYRKALIRSKYFAIQINDMYIFFSDFE